MLAHVTSVESGAELQALEPEWGELWSRAADPEPAVTQTWMLTWWKTFATDDRRLRALAVRDGDRLIGLFPLLERHVRDRRVFTLRRLESIATGEDEADEINSDFVGPLAEAGLEAEVASAAAAWLVERAADWDELLLSQASSTSRALQAFEFALAERGVSVAERPRGTCPSVLLPRTFDDYLRGLDDATRSRITRTLDALDASAGRSGWRLLRARSVHELARGTQVLRGSTDGRWRPSGPFRAFHDAVMPQLLARGELDLAWIEARGEPVALAYQILSRRRVHQYACSAIEGAHVDFDAELAMTAVALRDAIEKRLDEYVFVNGATALRRALASGSTRNVVTMRAPSPSPRGRALDVARRAADAAARRARMVLSRPH